MLGQAGNGQYICSAQSRNRYNSDIVLRKIGILTLPGEVRIPAWRGSIPDCPCAKQESGQSENLLFSLCKVHVGIVDKVSIHPLSGLYQLPEPHRNCIHNVTVGRNV